jgi:hypothetical protein
VIRLRRCELKLFKVVIATLTYFALQIEPSAAASMCSNLTGLSLPQTTITLARLYRAGEMVSGVTKAPVGLCRGYLQAKRRLQYQF